MTCKGICIRHRAEKPLGHFGRSQARNAVRYVQYISDGTEYGALVVDVELGQDHVIQSLNKN